MNKESKIYLAGHDGMVGSAILRNLKLKGFSNFVYTPFPEYDLTNQQTVRNFFKTEKPEYVIDAAAKVGGIIANNTYRAQFIYENIMIQNNLVHASYVYGAKKLLFLGSSCIYPKNCPQPIKEEFLLTGELEITNEPYAIAKISGIKMCENYYKQYGCNFVSVMPTNLYGPNDNFDLETSHVLPALIRKFHEGKINNLEKVEIWGTGKPKREFLYVDDLADVCVFLMEILDAKDIYSKGITHLNIGTGQDISISDLALLISNIIGFGGDIFFDKSKPDGTLRKLLCVDRLSEKNWIYKTSLEEGISKTYDWFLNSL